MVTTFCSNSAAGFVPGLACCSGCRHHTRTLTRIVSLVCSSSQRLWRSSSCKVLSSHISWSWLHLEDVRGVSLARKGDCCRSCAPEKQDGVRCLGRRRIRSLTSCFVVEFAHPSCTNAAANSAVTANGREFRGALPTEATANDRASKQAGCIGFIQLICSRCEQSATANAYGVKNGSHFEWEPRSR